MDSRVGHLPNGDMEMARRDMMIYGETKWTTGSIDSLSLSHSLPIIDIPPETMLLRLPSHGPSAHHSPLLFLNMWSQNCLQTESSGHFLLPVDTPSTFNNKQMMLDIRRVKENTYLGTRNKQMV